MRDTSPVTGTRETAGVVRLEVSPGEYWWGGDTSDGYRMPFADAYRADLRRPGDNQVMPVLVSSHGRYVWSESPFAIEFSDSVLTIRAHDGAAIEVGHGDATLRGGYLAAASHFAPAGQRPADAMFTAPQYNLWIDMPFRPTQQAVLSYADHALDSGFPPGVLVIDDTWSESYGTWDFHSGRFPDPQAMIARLHEQGFAVMLWLVPLVTPDTPVFRSLAGRGLLIRGQAGEPAIGRWWNGYGAAIDLLNPEGSGWLAGELLRLRTETGVDGFKFDGGDVSFYDSLGAAGPERYTAAWNALAAAGTMNELRASWLAAGLPLVQRQRDKAHSWAEKDGLASLIPDGLAQGLTGHAFTCPDMIAGGDYRSFPAARESAALDPELFVRSAQCQALFPMMQFSAAPWRLLDSGHLALCRDAAELHAAHAAEILRLADDAARTGEPIQRHLAYVFPGSGYEHVRDQFMLGDDLMVAPVTVKGQDSRNVLIPPGDWTSDDGTHVAGPCATEIDVPLARLPRFRRAGGS
jgi:alpha-glucosidase (family GH31 glycosyl hydrolase)